MRAVRAERSVAAPDGFKAPANTLLTYNPTTNRLYVHLLAWPMGEVLLEGYADRVKYAQLLHDASEVRMSTRKSTTWIRETTRAPGTWCSGCRS